MGDASVQDIRANISGWDLASLWADLCAAPTRLTPMSHLMYAVDTGVYRRVAIRINELVIEYKAVGTRAPGMPQAYIERAQKINARMAKTPPSRNPFGYMTNPIYRHEILDQGNADRYKIKVHYESLDAFKANARNPDMEHVILL